MNIIPTPHDRFFRYAMSVPRLAEEFFKKHLPEKILSQLDLKTLELCPQTYVDEHLKLSQVDALFKVKMKGQMVFLYCLGEHLSRPDRYIPFRKNKYNIHIWDDYLKECESNGKKDAPLPLIINLIFYNGKEPYPHSLDFKDLFSGPKELIEELLNKPAQLIDVYRMPDDIRPELRWTRILEFFMKNAKKRDFLRGFQKEIYTLKLIDAEGGGDFVIACMKYALNAVDATAKKELIEIAKQNLSKELGDKVVTIADSLREEGFKKGIQEGVQQGMQQGEFRLFLAQLKRKFAHVPRKYMTLLQNADENSLLRWGERIIDAATLKEIFTA